jgi:hypothetical protein
MAAAMHEESLVRQQDGRLCYEEREHPYSELDMRMSLRHISTSLIVDEITFSHVGCWTEVHASFEIGHRQGKEDNQAGCVLEKQAIGYQSPVSPES